MSKVSKLKKRVKMLEKQLELLEQRVLVLESRQSWNYPVREADHPTPYQPMLPLSPIVSSTSDFQ